MDILALLGRCCMISKICLNEKEVSFEKIGRVVQRIFLCVQKQKENLKKNRRWLCG